MLTTDGLLADAMLGTEIQENLADAKWNTLGGYRFGIEQFSP